MENANIFKQNAAENSKRIVGKRPRGAAVRVVLTGGRPRARADAANGGVAAGGHYADVFTTVRAPPRRSSALSVPQSKSSLYGAFEWARRGLNGPKTAVPGPGSRPSRGPATSPASPRSPAAPAP
jgi:hypothetical protein